MKEDRIKELDNYIAKNESASIAELCTLFSISKNTLRRDINELEKQGKIRKVYGGIVLNDKKTTEPFEAREVKNKEAKQVIAELASGLVKDGDIIYIDSGTTTMHMIPHLSEKSNVTIITNNLHVITGALPYPNLNVIATGGTLFRTANSFVDAEAINFLKKYNFSKAFMATTGVTTTKGVTNSSSFEYEIKRFVVENCNKAVLLADSSKLDRISLITYSDLKDIEVFVTEAEPADEYIEYFNEHGIDLLIP